MHFDGKGHARVGEVLRDQLRLSQQTFRIKAAGSWPLSSTSTVDKCGHPDLDRQGAWLLVQLSTSEVLERLSQAPVRQIEPATFDCDRARACSRAARSTRSMDSLEMVLRRL